MRKLLILIAFLIFGCQVSMSQYITFDKGAGGFDLSKCSINYADDEWDGVKIAVKNLQEDIFKVTGKRPAINNQNADYKLIVGTIGKSKSTDALIKQHKIDVAKVSGVWAAGMIAKHDYAVLNVSSPVVFPSPKVKYRGIFLNDEAPCLSTWVKNTFPDSQIPTSIPELAKGMNSHFYAKVFELLLRLKANFMWPAMWGNAFYADDTNNSKTADMMGIIMGTSHHEPMARNHQEWARNRDKNGAWDYASNQKVIDQFFREGIRRSKDNEDLITIGMRGDGDAPMGGKEGHDDEYVNQLEKNKKLMERIIQNQRKIIAKETGKPAAQRQQVWALYKEVQEYYEAGLQVPEDVIILVSDDNWGNIRKVPDVKRKGGWGIYYHVDYVGAPRNSKWLNITQTQQMFEQLSLAYDFGIEKLWVLNVGDLKPMEYPIQLFCDMAYDPKTYNLQNVTNHTEKFFETVVGKDFAKEAARIYNRNCQYMARVTPEMMDARTYNVKTGEFKMVADEYARLEAEALRLYLVIPEQCKDAYRQLILFPVQAMANLYDMYYAQAKNHQLAKENNPMANAWAKRVEDCFARDAELATQYHKLNGGKWNHMMDEAYIGYTSWNGPEKKIMPEVKRVKGEATGTLTFPTPAYITYRQPKGKPFFVAKGGYVSIEAEHFTRKKDGKEATWTILGELGRTLSGITPQPVTAAVDGMSLEYDMKIPSAATAYVTLRFSPSLNFNVTGLRYAISFDGGEEQVVNINGDFNGETGNEWHRDHIIDSRTTHHLKKGKHTLRIRPLDNALVLQKILIDLGGLQKSYLGPQETVK